MEKIKSGIIGLNPLLDGGVNKGSTTVVIGGPGVGKTTFAIQFLRRGLEAGNDGLFVSLDENQEQIINEAMEMGWDEINDYLEEESLVFIDAGGKKFSDFIRMELPTFVDEWKGSDSRIVVDPLTPVMWAVESRYEQRELLMLLFKEMKKIGTLLCTLEEYGSKDLSGSETVIPMYLADSIVHMRFEPAGASTIRKLEIVKCRNSRHSSFAHQYTIIKGLGLVVQRPEEKVDRKISKQLKDELNRKLSVLPKPAITRIQSSIDKLIDKDFKGVDISALISDLIEDYEDMG